MSRKLTTAQFIEKARAVHGDRYDYSLAEYVNAKEKVRIICAEHGEFLQDAFSHSKGVGCPKCAVSRLAKEKSTPVDVFIKTAANVHKGFYSYDSVAYKNARSKVEITCPIHGMFLQSPYNHLKGHGCAKCRDEGNSIRNSSDTDEFVRKAEEIHGGEYSYELVKYTAADEKVEITCKEHGPFLQTPGSHLRGSGCPLCGKNKNKKLNDREEVLARFRCMHGNTYDYSLFEYHGVDEKAAIICKKHGIFWQPPYRHLEGCGCPTCGGHLSKAENRIADVLGNFTKVEKGNRTLLNGKEIDIFLPEYNTGIEYNGSLFHSEKYSKDPINHMRDKQMQASAVGIRLVHITDYEPLDVAIRTLLYITGINSERVFARRCSLAKLPATDLRVTKFLSENHLQGPVNEGTAYLLTDDKQHNDILACMVFSPPASRRGISDQRMWELRRYASKKRVIGGAGKLLRRFLLDNPQCSSVISYSDNRWFTGEMYAALGFTKEKTLRPDYKYVKGRKILPKNKFRRSELIKMRGFDFNEKESEHENCLRNGWYRIYDCGKTRWVLTI